MNGAGLLRTESKWRDTSKMAGESIFCDVGGNMYK